MIALDTLAKTIEDNLNANTLGIKFKIFSDAGDYERALKSRAEKERYTNGLLTSISSAVYPVRNLIIATQSVNLKLAIQLFDKSKDAETIHTYRKIIDGVFQTATTQYITDENGKTFSVAAEYSLMNTDIVDAVSPLGTHLAVEVKINYSMIENGLNSSVFFVTLDGVPLGYNSVTMSRATTFDSSTYSDSNGETENIPTATTLNIHMEIPATVDENAANTAIWNYLLDGDAWTEHELTLDKNGSVRTYTCRIGQINCSIEGVKNAGHVIDFVRARKVGDSNG